jgi:hypothetical protein
MTFKINKRDQLKQMRAIFRRRRKVKLRTRKRNFLKNKRKKSRSSKSSRKKWFENVTIDVPKEFSLFQNAENVISVINVLDKHKKINTTKKNIEIDLSSITTIDIGAISALLAKIYEMAMISNITVWGRPPLNQDCRKLFSESGFLDYMTDLSGKKFSVQSDNFFFKVGSDKTRNEQVGSAIEKAMKYLTATADKYPPVYSIVQEICSNSVEWANAPQNKNKNWFLGINKRIDNENMYISFTMTDMGYGILNTLKRKFATLIAETFTKDTDVLKRAFERKYGSKTREANRNRGLPLIMARYINGYIKDLKVITNNVLYDFNSDQGTRLLAKNFPGTFYFWNLDINCIEKWRQIKEG